MNSGKQEQPMLLGLLDWFCGDGVDLDSVYHLRRRVLVGFLLAQLLILPLCTIYSLLFSTVDPAQAVKLSWVTGGMALWYLAILFAGRQLRNFHGFIYFALIGILAAVAAYIGMIGTEIAESEFLLVIVPTLGFCLLGLWQGLLWSALAVATLLALRMWEPLAVLAITFTGSDAGNVELVMWVVASTSMVSLQMTYAYLTGVLSQRLIQERQRRRQQATQDYLTGLGNRQSFEARVDEQLAQARRGGHLVAVVCIDIIDFKDTNDRHGHEAGDNLLREAAKRVSACLRETDTAARIGGDQFALLLSPVTSRDGMEQVLGRLQEQLSLSFRFGGEWLPMRAALGGAVYPSDADAADALLNVATRAMHNRKYADKLSRRYAEHFAAQEVDAALSPSA